MTRADLPASPTPLASLTAANARRIAVVLQCAATLAVAWVAHHWGALRWPGTAAVAAAALVLGYLISVGWAFLIASTSLGTAIPDDPVWDRMPVPREQRIGARPAVGTALRIQRQPATHVVDADHAGTGGTLDALVHFGTS